MTSRDALLPFRYYVEKVHLVVSRFPFSFLYPCLLIARTLRVYAMRDVLRVSLALSSPGSPPFRVEVLALRALMQLHQLRCLCCALSCPSACC